MINCIRSRKIHCSVEFGIWTIIEAEAVIDEDCRIGDFCKIMPNVKIGKNCQIMDYVKLMPGTVIGDNCRLDDYVNTSGAVKIGANVRIKRCTMIGQATEIEDNVWIGSHVTTVRMKYPNMPGQMREEWSIMKRGCIVGSHSLIMAGVTIGEGAIVGAGAVITKDCEPGGIYIGHPAKLVRNRND